jgi:hypothetical protein
MKPIHYAIAHGFLAGFCLQGAIWAPHPIIGIIWLLMVGFNAYLVHWHIKRGGLL